MTGNSHEFRKKEEKSRQLIAHEERLELAREMEIRRMMIKRKRRASDVPIEIIADELELQKGNVSRTAKELNIAYASLSDLVERSVLLRNVIIAQRESLVDDAEHQIRQQVQSGSLRASIFVLETLGKTRGFIKKAETDAPPDPEGTTRMKVDLKNLTSDQLRQLQDIMKAADDPNIIDVTPEVINE